jgi:hypothetical protein
MAPALLAIVSLGLAAADTPDFSGTWKMNMAKSDLGQMPVPDKYEMTVAHKEPEVKATTVTVGQMGERKSETVYKTDGTETTNRMGQNESKSVAKWEGKVLSVVTKGSFQGNSIEILTKWSLSDDGKTLTMDQTFKSDMGEMATKRVLDKQ